MEETSSTNLDRHIGDSTTDIDGVFVGKPMIVLYLLFPFEPADLMNRFYGLDHDACAITAADGFNRECSNGAMIFQGISFNFEMIASAGLKPDYKIFCHDDGPVTGSALGLGLGAAVASGQMTQAVVAALFELGLILGSQFGAKATFWTPTAIQSGFAFFEESISNYLAGAAFPSLLCVGFDTETDDQITTTGLNWFCGQELVFQRDGLAVHEAMRYVVRLVHDLALNGAVANAIDVPSLDGDELLMLRPHTDPDHVLVRRRRTTGD